MVANNESTKRLIGASLGFLIAAQGIRDYKEMFHWPAFYTNVYYAVEMSLKAYLSSRGLSRDELRKIGHVLVDLVKHSYSHGFIIRDHGMAELIRQIDGRLMDFRYLEGGTVSVVEADQTIRLIDAHIRAIAVAIPIDELIP